MPTVLTKSEIAAIEATLIEAVYDARRRARRQLLGLLTQSRRALIGSAKVRKSRLTSICWLRYALAARVCQASEGVAVPSVNTPDQIVGRSLKLERVGAGVKLIDVAARVGISPGHLSRIESGERKADSAMIARIRVAIAGAA